MTFIFHSKRETMLKMKMLFIASSCNARRKCRYTHSQHQVEEPGREMLEG